MEKELRKEVLGGTPNKDSFVLLPSTHQEIAETLKIANSKRIPVRMKKTENLDVKNLIVHVQRGISFEELNSALKEHSQKVLPPVPQWGQMRQMLHALNHFCRNRDTLPLGD